jgi:hypothetical protein
LDSDSFNSLSEFINAERSRAVDIEELEVEHNDLLFGFDSGSLLSGLLFQRGFEAELE